MTGNLSKASKVSLSRNKSWKKKRNAISWWSFSTTSMASCRLCRHRKMHLSIAWRLSRLSKKNWSNNRSKYRRRLTRPRVPQQLQYRLNQPPIWTTWKCHSASLRVSASLRKHTIKSSRWSIWRSIGSGKTSLRLIIGRRIRRRTWKRWLLRSKRAQMPSSKNCPNLTKKTSTCSNSSSMCAQLWFARRSKVMSCVTTLRRLIERFENCTFRISSRCSPRARSAGSGLLKKRPSLRKSNDAGKKSATKSSSSNQSSRIIGVRHRNIRRCRGVLSVISNMS